MTSTASARTEVATVPALKTSYEPPPKALNNPSAIWDRALLWVQRNRIRLFIVPVSGFKTETNFKRFENSVSGLNTQKRDKDKDATIKDDDDVNFLK
jgi:hypothetical protein